MTAITAQIMSSAGEGKSGEIPDKNSFSCHLIFAIGTSQF